MFIEILFKMLLFKGVYSFTLSTVAPNGHIPPLPQASSLCATPLFILAPVVKTLEMRKLISKGSNDPNTPVVSQYQHWLQHLLILFPTK